MLYLIYGTDKYRKDAFVEKLKKAAKIGADGLNMIVLDNPEVQALSLEVETMPFLGDKRLVIVQNMLSTKDKTKIEKLGAVLDTLPETTDLVFYEADQPDNRLTVVKTLKQKAKVTEFSNLTPFEEITFIKEYVKSKNGKIESADASYLQRFVGSDLIRLTNEIDKLLAFDKVITKQNIDLLVNEGYFNSIFDFTDAIGQKNTKKAILLLEKLFENGEDVPFLVSILSGHIRNLMLVSDLSSHHLSQTEIASKAKLHPFVVRKASEQIRNFTIDDLVNINKGLLEIEIDTKTGGPDPKGSLESLILTLTKK